ncbi:MAG: malectin domain-containing carbohydrate-binding protein, partial [Planctomycetota bacterium]
MRRDTSLLNLSLSFTLLICISCNTFGAVVSNITIISPSRATAAEHLAAKEIRRYLYLRTGKLFTIVQTNNRHPLKNPLIIVGQKDWPVIKTLTARNTQLSSIISSLQPQQYLLKTMSMRRGQAVLIIGGDSIGTLYAAYRFAEHLGVRFYMHGDTIPDKQIALYIPKLDEKGKPLFNLRGIQPFHDFPEGPDWWNTDDYKAVIGQLPKMRMNFFGLHTYPQGGVGPEPTVWIGMPDDFNEDGTVKFSYPSRHFATPNTTGAWGYKPAKTSDYSFGAAQMFERDDYGPDYMRGMNPWPQLSPVKANELFNRMGETLKEAFEYAHSLGVKTCVGTETPLIIPDSVKERLNSKGMDPTDPAVVQKLYEGMFQRITKAYPLDYYWFWTPEGWTWGNPKDEQIEATLADFRAAIAAAKKVKPTFTLATCGWVLGPPKDRALFDNFLPKEMPVSCINRNVGFAPVEQGFARIEGRPQWAIPWLEDDPALIIPQLWAGRMRRDAADAHAYGCTGLLGIHWRTRILGPNVSALSHAAWQQKKWNPEFGRKIKPSELKPAEGREGGNTAKFPNNPIADTQEDKLYHNVIWNVKAYRLKVPNDSYTVTLKFCEPHYNSVNKRVFGVKLQNEKVIDKLDIFAEVGKDRALDYTFEDVKVTDGLLHIDFVSEIEFPCIAAFVVQSKDITRKINCGGLAYKDYKADLPASSTDERPRDLPARDFYADWALTQFGPEVFMPIAELFTKLDGGPMAPDGGRRAAHLPRPSTWVNGPGGINPDKRPWQQVNNEYAFIEKMAKLRPQVKGAGNLERFDYWLNNFRYLRAIGQVNCTWAKYNEAIKKLKDEKQINKQKQLARKLALPLRKELVAQVSEVHRYLLATVTTNGAMGNVTNWQQHIIPKLLTEPGQELAKLLGEDLPADAIPSNQYLGLLRIFVPTVRTSLNDGEDLKLKVIIMSQNRTVDASLYWRIMGKGKYNRIVLKHIA